jgi:hypothetical protein
MRLRYKHTLKLARTLLIENTGFYNCSPNIGGYRCGIQCGAPSGQSAEFLAPKVDILAYLILSVSLAIVQGYFIILSPPFSNAEGAQR